MKSINERSTKHVADRRYQADLKRVFIEMGHFAGLK